MGYRGKGFPETAFLPHASFRRAPKEVPLGGKPESSVVASGSWIPERALRVRNDGLEEGMNGPCVQ